MKGKFKNFLQIYSILVIIKDTQTLFESNAKEQKMGLEAKTQQT